MRVLDRCVPIIEHVLGGNLQYRIDFVFENNDQQTPSFKDILDETMLVVYGDIIDYATICDLNIVSSRIDEDSLVIEALLLRSVFYPTSIREAYERMKDLIETKNQEYVTKSIPYRVRLGTALTPVLHLNSTLFVEYEIGTGDCSDNIAIDERQFCRFVVVADTEFDLRNGELKDHEYIDVEDLSGQLNTYICEDVYVQKMMSKRGFNSNANSRKQYWPLAMVALLICMFDMYTLI